ncbi:palmdelphin [Nematolebias whitei]|uniref:palmdelphin n=1 Tax=Nematolebias whitei TaxID=451745 RepID=UPI0018979280|nr:palmdelphin [Nematolebias whitei]
MEEADLLKERIQAITDKRRIQEDIVKKRRQIEEEKLKLQYIKKKSLREQWLMDGLSQQSEEEQEALRLQAQEEQQQSDQLQSNILRIEKEIEALETKELNISANEEVLLKRLKEVERTPEDIIKDVNAEFHTDVLHHVLSPVQDVPLFVSRAKAKTSAVCEAERDETKKATFALKISVEHNKKTGKSQVLSAETVSPESIPERGMKVYDDGRKYVYALQSERDEAVNSATEMTPTEVEELLHEAAEEKVHPEVHYHQPVYSVPYMGTRPSTPRNPSQTLLTKITPEDQNLPQKYQQGSSSSGYILDANSKMLCFNTSGQSKNEKTRSPGSNFGDNRKTDPSPVSFIFRSEGTPSPIQPVYRDLDQFSPSLTSKNAERKLVSTLPKDPEPESITMIFMGYENAADEEEDVKAELVMLDDDEEEEDETDSCGRVEYLAFHPEGCNSKVFQPKVGQAKVSRGRDVAEDACRPAWEELELHKPTFIHKSGKLSCHLQNRGSWSLKTPAAPV